MNLQIAIDPLEGPQVAALLQAHLDEMHRISPPESVHALDLSRLRAADITFWSAYQGDTLLGCAALRALDAAHGEVKSMRTTPQARRRGGGAPLGGEGVGAARPRGPAPAAPQSSEGR